MCFVQSFKFVVPPLGGDRRFVPPKCGTTNDVMCAITPGKESRRVASTNRAAFASDEWNVTRKTIEHETQASRMRARNHVHPFQSEMWGSGQKVPIFRVDFRESMLAGANQVQSIGGTEED